MTSSYWPDISEVRRCIKTEAEEFSDAVLMAVHEPMKLERLPAGETQAELVDESKLLEHVIATNRPTPILGESGFGKSHVIRWLDVNLRRRDVDGSWHIVRIPKNASLKQALTILLEGLDGPLFDEARQKIESVGRGLNTRTVAQHLIVFVGARLEELYDESEQVLKAAQEQGKKLAPETDRRMRVVRKHAKRDGLVALIGDSFFNKQLIDVGMCFHQIAKRFTEGSSDDEIEENAYQVEASDLEINAELGDLSRDAKRYVRNAQINTSEDARNDAVDLLNECLNDACREAFHQLFQFHSGSFQDLFQEIRASLKDSGKTLFILVEDMATISAIEDVLIDSLMQEDVRDGVQILCPLHSAIAVTSGYQGYARRKDTLKTRAKYEWLIGKRIGSAEETYERINNFCGRYLNAARFGEKALVDSFHESQSGNTWPGIWESGDKSEDDLADVFGRSTSKFPLFPYNSNAIRALSDRFVRPHEEVEFNPRKILQHILREPLENLRSNYTEGRFPPAEFASVPCPGSLLSELELAVRTDGDRSSALAAIWGYGAQTTEELAYLLPAPIAAEFALDALADVLENTRPKEPTHQPLPSPKDLEGTKGKDRKAREEERDRGIDPHAVSREVDKFFAEGNIPQRVANVIRQAIVDAYESALRDYKDWFGANNLPKLKKGPKSQPQIYIPLNPNNPAKTIIQFGTDKEFSDRTKSQKYKKFIVSVWRRAQEKGEGGRSWEYANGLQDYCNYKNFLDDWLPNIVSALVEMQQSAAKEKLRERLSATSVFVPRLPNSNLSEKISALVLTADQLSNQVSIDIGLENWDQYVASALADWDKKQALWLDAFSTNRHAIEGDLLIRAVRGTSDIQMPARGLRAAQDARQEFIGEFGSLSLLAGCAVREDYERVLRSLIELVSKLNSTGQFKSMDDITTARKYINKIKKIIERDNWPQVKCALLLQDPFVPAETINSLHGFNRAESEAINELLIIWKMFVARNLARLQNENAEQGRDRRKIVEDEFDGLLAQIRERFPRVEEQAV